MPASQGAGNRRHMQNFCLLVGCVVILFYGFSGSSSVSEVSRKKASDVRQNQQALQAEADSPSSAMVRESSSDEPAKVLVTGGLGFIGSHVVEELLSRGLRVLILDDESNGHNHNDKAKEIKGDITVVSDLSKLNSEEIAYVVHLAAAISVAESMKLPEKYERVNVEGSRKVFKWAQEHKVKNVVAASSAAVYGLPPPEKLPLSEDEPYAGISPYAKSKWDMEGVMKEAWAQSSLPSTALRFFNVYGPRQDPKNPYSGVISLFLQQGLEKKDVTILGDGEQTRDFVFVKDVAKAIATALLRPNPTGHGVFNVCTGKTTTINGLAQKVVELWGGESKVVHKEPRDGDIPHSSCKPDKAQAELGFVASVAFEDGLKQTLDWFKTTVQ
mmetsp:Transcript_36020/g.88632  ORF Transcript_36020/g.88632 Transcript_36020/m.88632 type:complete len:385 (-) Transcript_36020:1239-2393(-)